MTDVVRTRDQEEWLLEPLPPSSPQDSEVPTCVGSKGEGGCWARKIVKRSDPKSEGLRFRQATPEGLCVLCDRWRVTQDFVRIFRTGASSTIQVHRVDGYPTEELAFPSRDHWTGTLYPFVPLDPRTLSFDPLTKKFRCNETWTLLKVFLLAPSGSRDWVSRLMSVAFGQGSKVEQIRRVTKACLWSLFPIGPRDPWLPHTILPAALPLIQQLFPQGSQAPTTISFIEALKTFASYSDPTLDYVQPPLPPPLPPSAPTPSPSIPLSLPLPISLPAQIQRIHFRLAKEPVLVHICPQHPEGAQKARIRLWDGKLFCACGLEVRTVDVRGRIQWVEGFAWTLCSVCGKALSTLNAKSSAEEGAIGWRCLSC